ncbi:MAG: nicotinate (nicotinamide) nucleotide adenylyltransferase [Ruminococcus sp.]|nr:nicotinate (nicotinamide) nucleotide adenylyltransferase [Ruminococcus sp.]
MRLGIYGGTFDPVHAGHVRMLKAVTDSCGLDRTLVLPDRIPPHKEARYLTPGEDRAQMCRIAFRDCKNTEICDWELRQEGKSYSVLTLRHFHELYPLDRLFFIMGSDMLKSFHHWYRFEEILQLSGLICVSRSREDSRDIVDCANALRELGGEVIIARTEPLELSSTEIRERLTEGRDCKGLLDPEVTEYIKSHGLYGTVSQ